MLIKLFNIPRFFLQREIKQRKKLRTKSSPGVTIITQDTRRSGKRQVNQCMCVRKFI